jgi:hypothetical protein
MTDKMTYVGTEIDDDTTEAWIAQGTAVPSTCDCGCLQGAK